MHAEEGARLMYEDLKRTMMPRLELSRLEKQSRYVATRASLCAD